MKYYNEYCILDILYQYLCIFPRVYVIIFCNFQVYTKLCNILIRICILGENTTNAIIALHVFW